MNLDSTLCFDGGAIKALGDSGLIGGFGVLFTDENSPDLQGDFFRPPPETDYDLEDRRSVRLLYAHGLDELIGNRALSRATFEIQSKGIWFQAPLDRGEATQAQIYGLIKQGRLGFSSGSAAHLVRRVPVGNAMKITSWNITELSVTPRPVETRARVMALKSLVSEWPKLSYMVNPLQEKVDAELRRFEAIQRDVAGNWAIGQAGKADAYERETAQEKAEAEIQRFYNMMADFEMEKLERMIEFNR